MRKIEIMDKLDYDTLRIKVSIGLITLSEFLYLFPEFTPEKIKQLYYQYPDFPLYNFGKVKMIDLNKFKEWLDKHNPGRRTTKGVFKKKKENEKTKNTEDIPIPQETPKEIKDKDFKILKTPNAFLVDFSENEGEYV